MARPLRLEYPGALYHITSRGDRREAIYEDDEDRQGFITLLDEVCESYNWVCHAYCLMTDHYHLLIETPEGNLSRGMRQLNGVYTQAFNRRHGRVGHLFQGRFKAILIEKQAYLLEVARHIVLNPVRAQMVRTVRDWPWSSYRSTAGQTAPPEFLTTNWILSAFGKRKHKAQEGYRQFVSKGKGRPGPWEEVSQQVYLGSDEFIEQVQKNIEQDYDLDEIPRTQRRAPAKSLETYQETCPERNQAIYEAYRSGGYTLKSIGQYFGLHYSTVSGIVRNHKSKT